MKSSRTRPSRLACALLACIAATGVAHAQSPAPKAAAVDKENVDKELAAAREDLARAAQRVAELSRDTLPQAMQQAQRALQMTRRPVIGVVLAPDETAGVRVGGVTSDSAAAKAGLKAGDRIVSVDGSEILGDSAKLRVDNTRLLFSKLEENKPVKIGYLRDGHKASASVTPKLDDRVVMFDPSGFISEFGSPVAIRQGKDGVIRIESDSIETIKIDPADIQKQVDRAMRQVQRNFDCKGKDCDFPQLAEAFRWNGLNLATVDPQLGRYFGTDKGVLVVSASDELGELQPGDVIRRIDNKEVNTPREAMAALRAKPADSSIAVEYLRDRKNARAQVKVPKAVPFQFPLPPTLPPPPTPPAAPAAPRAPRAPVAPTPPAAPQAITQRKVVIVGADGKRSEWEDGGTGVLPPLPANGQHIEKHVQVFVDENGNRRVIESDELPPPPTPPAAPALPAAPAKKI